MSEVNNDVTEDSAKEGKYLTFQLGEEEYGINILKVKEIISMIEITKIPHTPAFVKGIINLRGNIIPVIDLRLKFSMEEKEYTDRTCIIVVEIEHENAKTLMSITVDFVSEVLNIPSESIGPTPNFGTAVHVEYISGLAKIENKVKILLSIEKVMGEEDLANILNSVKLAAE
jgi:purine-binding chemotaxis protein CheW